MVVASPSSLWQMGHVKHEARSSLFIFTTCGGPATAPLELAIASRRRAPTSFLPSGTPQPHGVPAACDLGESPAGPLKAAFTEKGAALRDELRRRGTEPAAIFWERRQGIVFIEVEWKGGILRADSRSEDGSREGEDGSLADGVDERRRDEERRRG